MSTNNLTQQPNTTEPTTSPAPQKPPMHWFLKLMLESLFVGAATLALAFSLAWFGN